MPVVTAHQNETLDQICKRVFGNSEHLEELYVLNQNISESGTFLPLGTEVVVPDRTSNTTQLVKKTKLWD